MISFVNSLISGHLTGVNYTVFHRDWFSYFIERDWIYQSRLLGSFLKYLQKQGKKTVAEQILYQALLKIEISTDESALRVFSIFSLCHALFNLLYFLDFFPSAFKHIHTMLNVLHNY